MTTSIKTCFKCKEEKEITMYELIIADADTPLFRAAKSVQEDYILATMPWGEVMEFPNVTALWGHHKKKEGGWLAEYNKTMAEAGQEPLSPENIGREECSRLSPDIDDHLAEAEKQFDYFVGGLKRTGYAEDYRLVLGGEGNFRYDCAVLQPYKGKRKPKPLLFQEVKDFLINKYKKKVILANDQEADDILGIMGTENYAHYKKTGEWRYILAYIDKDIDMVVSPSFSYNDPEATIRIPTPFEAAKCFAVQMTCGDKAVDNIMGLPNLTEEIVEKYHLRKTKGIGKATAKELLRTCENIQELFARVTEAYRSYYGVAVHQQQHHDISKGYYDWDYLDYMQDTAILLWMRQKEGEMFDIRKFLTRINVLEGEENVTDTAG
jgi:hypothetical protein